MLKKRFSIHQKVFFSFSSILLLSVLITLLFGNSMMERLYIQSKSNDLSKAYSTITSAIDKQEHAFTMNHELWECFFEIEQNNVDILLLTVESSEQAETELRIRYFTRQSWKLDPLSPPERIHMGRDNINTSSLSISDKFGPYHWIEEAAQLGVFQDAALPLLVTEKNNPVSPEKYQTMDYYGCYIKENLPIYIFLSTPKEAVTLAAGLAVKYNLYIALATFLLMTITSYYISRRITKPIAEISDATNQISKMDFTQPLEIRTGDELEELSDNINDMAKKLQNYIDQMQLTQQLLEKDLEREAYTGRMRQEFIANVTHDFKTPLTLIRAYTESLRNQSIEDEERVQYCDIILDENERLNHMVTQLLQLSRLESGIVKLDLSFFSMEELMREVLCRNHLLIQNKQLAVIWQCQEDEHIVQGDYIWMEHVIVNLVENAIKYTPAHGTISLQVKGVQEQCCVTVSNTCEALTEYQLENLFNSFYKTDESRHMEQQSFGLGLAIVKAILDLHQQTCWAENTPSGLAVSFTLPLMQIEDEELDEV